MDLLAKTSGIYYTFRINLEPLTGALVGMGTVLPKVDAVTAVHVKDEKFILLQLRGQNPDMPHVNDILFAHIARM